MSKYIQNRLKPKAKFTSPKMIVRKRAMDQYTTYTLSEAKEDRICCHHKL